MSPIAARGFNPPDPEFHRLSVADAFRKIGSRQEGLSPMEAAERLRIYGPNRVERVTKAPTVSVTPLGLGVESSSGRDIMKIFPRPPRRPLMDLPLALRSCIFPGMMEAVAGHCGNGGILFRTGSGGWDFGVSLPTERSLYRSATAICPTAIIVTQTVNVFVCRSSVRSAFSMPLLDNRVILAGVALEITLMALFDYSAWGNLLLDTAPVPLARLWPFLLPFAIVMLLAAEARKWLALSAHTRQSPLPPLCTV